MAAVSERATFQMTLYPAAACSGEPQSCHSPSTSERAHHVHDGSAQDSAISPRADERIAARAERARITDRLLQQAQTAGAERRRELLDEVVLINRCVAEAIARRYGNRGVPSQDLQQAAYEGRSRPCRSSTPRSGPTCSRMRCPPFAERCSATSETEAGWSGRRVAFRKRSGEVNRSVERLTQTLGREPSHLEVSQDLDCSESTVREAVEAFGSFTPSSLERPLDGSPSLRLADTLVDTASHDSEAAEARASSRLRCAGSPPGNVRSSS